MACPTPPLKEAKQQGEMSSLIPILGAVADGPGPPVQPLFLTKDDLESDQWQPPRSPVVCPPLPVPDACATMAGEREKSLREAQVGETPAALEQVSQKKELFEFLDSPVHVFNPPRELEAGQDHLHTQGGGTEEEFPVQPETNDGKGELVLDSQGWRVETTDGGTKMWLVVENQDGTLQRSRIFK